MRTLAHAHTQAVIKLRLKISFSLGAPPTSTLVEEMVEFAKFPEALWRDQ